MPGLLRCQRMPDNPFQDQQPVLTDIPTRRIALGGLAALFGVVTLLNAEPAALRSPPLGLALLAVLVGLSKTTTA